MVNQLNWQSKCMVIIAKFINNVFSIGFINHHFNKHKHIRDMNSINKIDLSF